MHLSFPSVHKNVWLAAFLAVAIVLVGSFILHHVSSSHHDVVATGLLGDMVITFPVTYYFLVVRPLKQRKWSIMLVFTCSCAVAYFILPAHQQHYLLQLRKLSALVEIAGLLYCLGKFKKIRTGYRLLQAEFPDPAYHIYQSMAAVLGNGIAVKILASELSILRFGLLCWKRQPLSPEVVRHYTVHKGSGYAALFGVMLGVCLIEAGAMHLLLVQYSKTATWILTGLSIYGTLFLAGDFSAIVKSPIMVMKDQLVLRTGLRWRAIVKTDNIASVEKVSQSFQAGAGCFNGSLLESSTNILFTFKHPVSIERLYKKPVMVSQLAMCIDDAGNLLTAYNNQ